MNYTQAQIDRANAVSLEDFLRTQGETLIKSGREYRWKEHDSLTAVSYTHLLQAGTTRTTPSCGARYGLTIPTTFWRETEARSASTTAATPSAA